MNTKILWADDEIDLLKPHILFLKAKGYDVIPVVSGNEAIEVLQKEIIDIIFLDEQMPGLNGIETMKRIKTIKDQLKKYAQEQIGDKDACEIKHGRVTCMLKKSVSVKADEKAMKKDGIWDKYAKTSETARFTVTISDED